MYNSDTLNGIFISLASAEVNIVRSPKSNLGYRVRLRICIRGNSNFLLGIQRSLLQYEISSNYKESEHKGRPRPILIISGLDNLTRVLNLLTLDTPTNGEWTTFTKTLFMVKSKQHLSASGLDKILTMKGLL